MTSPTELPIRILVLCNIVLCVSTIPVRDEANVPYHVTSTIADDSIIPTTEIDGVTLLRRALIGVYEDGMNDFRARMKSNLNAIEVAIERGNAVWKDLLRDLPTAEKRNERPPIVIGQGTNLNLYVLSQKMLELQNEERARRVRENEKTFQSIGKRD